MQAKRECGKETWKLLGVVGGHSSVVRTLATQASDPSSIPSDFPVSFPYSLFSLSLVFNNLIMSLGTYMYLRIIYVTEVAAVHRLEHC